MTESITAHESRPTSFSIVYRIAELSPQNWILASSGLGALRHVVGFLLALRVGGLSDDYQLAERISGIGTKRTTGPD